MLPLPFCLFITLSYPSPTTAKDELNASTADAVIDAADLSKLEAMQAQLKSMATTLKMMELRLVKSETLQESTQVKLKSLEQRLALTVVSSINMDTPLMNTFEVRSIEEDVQQNKEDIIDLRINDGHHDMLLSQEMGMINNINNTIIPSLEHKVEASVPPIGSVIAWLPAYADRAEIPASWQRCDGSEIKTGPMAGMATPDLNGARLFMRGSSDESAGTVENDTVEDHEHADPGHTHEDAGHAHLDSGHDHYHDPDSEHDPALIKQGQNFAEGYMCSDNCGGWVLYHRGEEKTASAKASITTDKASIQTSQTGVAGMTTGRKGGETRPKNMSVVYIIKIV